MATITGTSNDDRFDDELIGTDEADLISGLEGRDDLTGLAGNDTLDGGAGDRDTARYYDAPSAIEGNLTTGIVLDGYGGTDTLIDIEEIRGSRFNDTLTGSESGVGRLRGRDGDDFLIGNNTSEEGGTALDGGDGNDSLTSVGGEWSFLEPGAGDDVVTGGSSFDTLSYFFSAGYDDPPGEQGINVQFSSEGTGSAIDYRGDTDTFTSIERVEGTMLSDTIVGSDGFQSIQGRGGDDTLDGGADVDEVNYNGTRTDFAEQSGVIVDLAAGTAQDTFGDTDTLSNFQQVRGSDFADQITGNDEDNRIRAEDGDDTLDGGKGDDRLQGDEGTDTAIFEGAQSNYTLMIAADDTTITDRRADGEGTDELTSIEVLQFDTALPIFGDGPMDLDAFDDGVTLGAEVFSSIVELYIAYFNRAPDAIGLNFWASSFSRGEVDLAQMAELFFDQAETRAAYAASLDDTGGTITDIPGFVTAVYTNVLGRDFDDAGRDFWVGVLTRGEVTTGSFISSIIAGAKAEPESGAPQDFVDQQLIDRQYLSDKIDIGVKFAVIDGMSDTADASAVMDLFTGSEESIQAAVAQSDQFLTDAQGATDGGFLMPLVGVLDDPFEVA